MSPPPMDESLSTSSGNSTLISSPTTATTGPRTGQFHAVVLQEYILFAFTFCVFSLPFFASLCSALYGRLFPSPRSLKETSQPTYSLTTCMGLRCGTICDIIVKTCNFLCKANFLLLQNNIVSVSSFPLSLSTLHTPTYTAPTETLLARLTSRPSATSLVTKASLWWWRSCLRLSRAWYLSSFSILKSMLSSPSVCWILTVIILLPFCALSSPRLLWTIHLLCHFTVTGHHTAVCKNPDRSHAQDLPPTAPRVRLPRWVYIPKITMNGAHFVALTFPHELSLFALLKYNSLFDFR